MIYPLIILGAGASYDYPIGKEKIAPLTKDLVGEKFLYKDLLKEYEPAGNLLGEAIYGVKVKSESFEQVLTDILERDTAESTRKQFIALEFYLRALFKSISDPEHSPLHMTAEARGQMRYLNNYRQLLNRLDNLTEGKACVVSFNYDTLFEDNLPPETRPQRMRSYIEQEIQIIKPHGSHDWAYELSFSGKDFRQLGVKNEFELSIKDLSLFEDIRAKAELRHEQEIKRTRDSVPCSEFPAIALPLLGKDRHICPKDHIQALKDVLPSVNRVLIIGWRAQDPLLLEVMRDYLPKDKYKMLVVSNEEKSAERTADTVRKKVGARVENVDTFSDGGFSGFVADERSRSFLAK